MFYSVVRGYSTDGVPIRAMALNHLSRSVAGAGGRPAPDLLDLPSGCCSDHLRLGSPPAQADPLLNVVGQASPQRLAPHFLQAPYPQLPQPEVGELGDRPAPARDLARRLRLPRRQPPPAPFRGAPGCLLGKFADSTMAEKDRPGSRGPALGNEAGSLPPGLPDLGKSAPCWPGRGRGWGWHHRPRLPDGTRAPSLAACAPASLSPPIKSPPRSAVARTVSCVVKPPSATTCSGSRPKLPWISSRAGHQLSLIAARLGHAHAHDAAVGRVGGNLQVMAGGKTHISANLRLALTAMLALHSAVWRTPLMKIGKLS